MKNIIVERATKVVYSEDGKVFKAFHPMHPKSLVFNEAYIQSTVEELGLPVPRILEVSQIDGKWTLVIEEVAGERLKDLFEKHPERREELMDKFVDLHLKIHSKTAPRLTSFKEKFVRKIDSAKDMLNHIVIYDLKVRLESMPKHKKLCHGSYTLSNVIVDPMGRLHVVDWSHASLGNASGDVALTFIQLSMFDVELADLYMRKYCEKSGTARSYIESWIPIAAAQELTNPSAVNKDLLMQWVDVVDYI